MVATMWALTSASQASNYYEGDDYYTADDKSPSAWFGAAAERQGLSGSVQKADFVAALEGRTTDDHQLGTTREGKLEHRPGWDMTFSAPKSVSVMAEVAGDKRLIEAHDKAVLAAMAYVEQHGAATRIRNGGKVETAHTGSLAAAIFRHDTSRELDPQLHSHAVILNMTADTSGNWRSLESREIYRLYMKAGAIYHQHLASEARQLGYQIEQGKGSLFELKDVPVGVRSGFSQRSVQIEGSLGERGKNRATASAQEKNVVALDTRAPKTLVDRDQLGAEWRLRAASYGMDEKQLGALVAAAEQAASKNANPVELGRREAVADAAVAAAARSLSEHQSVVSAADLAARAGDYALGKISPADVRKAISSAQQRGDLEARRFTDNRGVVSKGFATRLSIVTESRMLASESRGRGLTPFLPRMEAMAHIARAILASRDQGFEWTKGQRSAAFGLLTATNRVVGLQGYAGTAKTTTVLATYADAMRRQGHVVRALAPTANAAALLGEAIGSGSAGQPEASTLAGLIQGGEKVALEARLGTPQTWIVDEASMVSAKDMARFLELAERGNARVVLVGDVKQLGSVEAGRAFGQLLDAGMQVWRLDEIVRQSNTKTKEAVMAAIAGDGRRALQALDEGGGKVIEHGEASGRVVQMARDFAALSRDERAQTLVLDPSREGREKLTDAIRTELVKEGSLGPDALRVSVLEARDMTREDARYARNYTLGDAVTFRRDYDRQGIEKGQAYTVKSIDKERNQITLADRDGRDIEWQLDKFGRGQVENFAQVEREFRSGDRLQFTRNDRELGRVNGQLAHVVSVDADKRAMLVRDARGHEFTVNADTARERHVRHGWVSTVYAAQGATFKRVMAHLESFRANTVDAKSLYVALSRAKEKAWLYVDSRLKLTEALAQRTGEKQEALQKRSVAMPKQFKIEQSSPVSVVRPAMAM